jgi:predicted nucleic acid-binding protein
VRVVADTGGIVAAINTAEPEHAAFRAARESAATAFITPLVITEVHHILTAAGLARAAAAFITDVTDGFYELITPTRDDYARAQDLVTRYAGAMRRKRRKPGSLDLADAINVVTAGRLGTNLLVATDEDYRRVTPLSGHPAFVLVPRDSPS